MAKRSNRRGKAKKPDKYAKQKMLAIPVLLLILGYVLFDNFVGGTDESSVTALPSVPPSVVPSRPKVSTTSPQSPNEQLAAWPEPKIDFLGRPSPLASYRTVGETFRPETEAPETMVARQQVEAKSRIENSIRSTLSSQTSQFVFKSANRKLALVGDRIVQQGEQLETGARLRDVRGNNLVIEVGRRVD